MLQISLIDDCPQQPGRLLQFPTHQDKLANPAQRRATGRLNLLYTDALPPAYETLVVRSPEDNLALGILRNELMIVDKVRRLNDGIWIVQDSNHRLKIIAPDSAERSRVSCRSNGGNALKEDYQFLGSLVKVLPGAKGLRYAHNVKPMVRKIAQDRHFSR